MLAHREAKEIALGNQGKIRVLTNLLAQHYPERTLIFTADNGTVYRISQELLIPAITHQTPVKERHEILTKFKQGEYTSLVASHVLNEGVDVPAASVAIILSGTGSTREYTQRLGRVLRQGKVPNKQAILYEVIAEDTSEEATSARRTGERKNLQVVYDTDHKSGLKVAEQLEINYSTKDIKDKRDPNVTNGVTEPSPERGGNHPEETET
jgi:superfamily II DNA or RNA helicase